MKVLWKRGDGVKVVVAMDSFKGSLSSWDAGMAVAKGIKKAVKDVKVEICPVADGGEGTVEALTQGMGGIFRTIKVTGPTGRPVEASYGLLQDGKTAVIEMSAAAGLTLVPEEERNPMKATTYGVGEMIRDAINLGRRRFIVGLGGSATNDGGTGMLTALGYKFLDNHGNPIGPGAAGLESLALIETGYVMSQLKNCDFLVACDVTNPLCGPQGCSAIYGPQKGADPEMIRQMDRFLAHYGAVTEETFGCAGPDTPGAGAAGGMGFAFLAYVNGRLRPGTEIVFEQTGLEECLEDADIVVTGEGRLDGQTAMGKTPMGVASLAKKHGIVVIALAGSVTEDAWKCNDQGIDAFFPILRRITTLSQAMEPETARQNLEETAEQIFLFWKALRL